MIIIKNILGNLRVNIVDNIGFKKYFYFVLVFIVYKCFINVFF